MMVNFMLCVFTTINTHTHTHTHKLRVSSSLSRFVPGAFMWAEAMTDPSVPL